MEEKSVERLLCEISDSSFRVLDLDKRIKDIADNPEDQDKFILRVRIQQKRFIVKSLTDELNLKLNKIL